MSRKDQRSRVLNGLAEATACEAFSGQGGRCCQALPTARSLLSCPGAQVSQQTLPDP